MIQFLLLAESQKLFHYDQMLEQHELQQGSSALPGCFGSKVFQATMTLFEATFKPQNDFIQFLKNNQFSKNLKEVYTHI